APACPELRAPRLHEVLAHPAVAELALGGKGVGSGGDGSAQLVAPDAAARDALAKRLETVLGVACLPLTIAPPRGGPYPPGFVGGDRLRRVVEGERCVPRSSPTS